MMEAAKLLSEPQIGKLNQDQQKLVTILNESMNRFHGLIDDLLHLSRLKARLKAIEKRPVNIIKVFSDIIQILEPMAHGKNLDVELVSVSGLKKDIPVDEERLFGAFMNILHNAVKFSPKNGKIKITLDYTDDNGKEWLKIGIIDAGPGVDKSETEKIFDKFYQIQTLRRKDGSGLGLAIAREIILAHGGKIWVESPPTEDIAVLQGKGAAFWSVLPYSP
jgi:signal transduction histidine kinase